MSRIITLNVKDFKRVREVHIEAHPHVNTIGGRNAQGKTSVLDAIAVALGGKKLMPKEPIRAGSDKSEITVKLDDLVVTRVTTAKTDRLVVTNAEGDQKRGPQDLLDSLWGSRTIDPAEFIRMTSRQQVDTIKRVLGLDFSEQDEKRKGLYDERTLINRTVKTLDGQLAGMVKHDDAPEAEVSVRDIAAALQKTREHNQRLEDFTRDRDRLSTNVKGSKEQIASLEDSLKDVRAMLDSDKADLAAQDERIANFKLMATSGLQEQLDNAEGLNQQVRGNARRAETAQELDGSRKQSAELTEAIDEIDEAKKMVLADADFPVEGLTFDETGLRVNDVPFEQASGAEKWRLSVAMGLAMHPGISVLLVREGEKLDEDSRKLLADMAVEQDAQLWIEDCRAADGEATVVIEDGQVKD